jgi:demethylmenaquinone methyltransferase/2-methoxy-6-polyprenyl-1,4-benzoquinol methylase
MPQDALERLLAEQVAYYRALAPDYDVNSPLPHDDASRAALAAALSAFQPRGEVLELACGTGQWTAELVRHASRVTAVDAAPEMLALASARVGGERARFVEADIFGWRPEQRYDVVFFSAWLSHVPPQHFDRFWALLDACLIDSGRVFLIDELPAVEAQEQPVPGAVAPAVERPLGGGTGHVVKVFYEPESLRDRLAKLGWEVEVQTVGWRFFYATGARAHAA